MSFKNLWQRKIKDGSAEGLKGAGGREKDEEGSEKEAAKFGIRKEWAWENI